MLASVQAEGFDDILRLTSTGLISEGRVANVFLKQQSGAWITPDLIYSCCLPGTTRSQILASDSTIIQTQCSVELLMTGEVTEIYLCNALATQQPVASVWYNGVLWQSSEYIKQIV